MPNDCEDRLMSQGGLVPSGARPWRRSRQVYKQWTYLIRKKPAGSC